MKVHKVLIFGGAGFLGKVLIKYLIKEGSEVYYADLNPIIGLENFFIYLDINDSNSFSKLDTSFNKVINLTGQISKPSSKCFELNTVGITNIIEFIKSNHLDFIHISSLAIFGSSKNLINDYSSSCPETTYGACKATAEYLIKKNLSTKKFTIIRLSNLYGENQKKGMIPYILNSIINHEKMFFNNDGTLVRYFLHVDDAATFIINFINTTSTGIYNFIGKDFLTIKEIIAIVEKIIHKNICVNYENKKPQENLINVCSKRLDENFNFTYKTRLELWLNEKIKKYGL